MVFDTLELEDTTVIYTAERGAPHNIPEAARQAWHELVNTVEQGGRDAYGYWHPPELEYRACFTHEEDDDPAALGLRQTVLPGGTYRRAHLEGDGAFDKIGATIDAVVEDANESVDRNRPFLEHYLGPNEVDVLVPIEPT